MYPYDNNDDQPEHPESGRFGSANTQSYTYPFQVLLMAIAGFFINQDLQPAGSGFIRVALGVEKNFWVWVFLGFMITNGVVSTFGSYTYYRITGRTFTDDRIGYAHAGAQDLSFWVGSITFALIVYIFGTYVPAGMLAWARPFVLVIVATIISSFIGRRLVLRVYANTLKKWMYIRHYS